MRVCITPAHLHPHSPPPPAHCSSPHLLICSPPYLLISSPPHLLACGCGCGCGCGCAVATRAWAHIRIVRAVRTKPAVRFIFVCIVFSSHRIGLTPRFRIFKGGDESTGRRPVPAACLQSSNSLRLFDASSPALLPRDLNQTHINLPASRSH